MQKLCSNCSEVAEYSLMFVLSSVGTTPRLQKCSRVHFERYGLFSPDMR